MCDRAETLGSTSRLRAWAKSSILDSDARLRCATQMRDSDVTREKCCCAKRLTCRGRLVQPSRHRPWRQAQQPAQALAAGAAAGGSSRLVLLGEAEAAAACAATLRWRPPSLTWRCVTWLLP